MIVRSTSTIDCFLSLAKLVHDMRLINPKYHRTLKRSHIERFQISISEIKIVLLESLLEISISAESRFFCRHVAINNVQIHTSYEKKRPKNIDFRSVVAKQDRGGLPTVY